MKILSKDPDLETIFNRIVKEEIDLQPDFQRDLVWNKAKKQSLIDTVLRNWQFPPIFVVVPDEALSVDVLDGQQRLNSVYEFFQNCFPVNGNIEPFDPNINSLDGLFYRDLPPPVKQKVNRYSIRFFELCDYNEDEPYELFFRLNQGSKLTPAERRNTLYGPIRDQVRDLVNLMKELEINIDKIGFNSSRLSYHDVISRFIYLLEKFDFSKKVTDEMLVSFFRSGKRVGQAQMELAEQSIIRLENLLSKKVKFNKSTLLSWLLFLSLENPPSSFLYDFEEARAREKENDSSSHLIDFLMALYKEKSSSSVNDATPVKLRLLVIQMVGAAFDIDLASESSIVARDIFLEFQEAKEYTESGLVSLMHKHGWMAN